MGERVNDRFIYTGRRNESGANFWAGEHALFTENYAGISSEAEFDIDVRPLSIWESVVIEPQNAVIGGTSLWVMAEHDPKEYKSVGEFLSFLSSSDVQASWYKNTGNLPITAEVGDPTRAVGFYEGTAPAFATRELARKDLHQVLTG